MQRASYFPIENDGDDEYASVTLLTNSEKHGRRFHPLRGHGVLTTHIIQAVERKTDADVSDRQIQRALRQLRDYSKLDRVRDPNDGRAYLWIDASLSDTVETDLVECDFPDIDLTAVSSHNDIEVRDAPLEDTDIRRIPHPTGRCAR